MEKISLADKLAQIREHWRPKLIGELNGQEVKLVKFRGEFVWHSHEGEDELFLALRGRFRIEFRDRTVELGPGEMVDRAARGGTPPGRGGGSGSAAVRAGGCAQYRQRGACDADGSAGRQALGRSTIQTRSVHG
jgi:hypothetical protein